MTRPESQLIGGPGGDRRPGRDPSGGGAAWLDWLRTHLDPVWRPGEWDGATKLFTGDLHSDRTAAWPCRTPGCPTATRRPHGRCDGCRRARTGIGLSWADYDADPPRHPLRPLLPTGRCAVPGCESELHCSGLCLRHEHAWRRPGSTESVAEFAARAHPFPRAQDCLVAGCAREQLARHGLCRFHDKRYLRTAPDRRTDGGLAGWVAAAQPRLGGHQFCLAGLPELIGVEVLYALQQRDLSPLPIDPTQVRILLSRLTGAASVREANPEAVCESGGVQYNSTTRALFTDLRRHLDRAWVQHTGADPFAGDLWQVALLGLHPNGSRRWPATQGVVDFRPVELPWLRESVKDWARTTRPYLQRLRETLRACRVASQTLTAAGRVDQTQLGAADFTRIIDAMSDLRRADGSVYSASRRTLLLYLLCEVIEHGRATGLLAQVPDQFRPARRRHRVTDEPNEDELGKALPDTVIRQLDDNLPLLGPAAGAGFITADDLQRMHRTIYQLLRDTGRRPGEVVSLHIDCLEVINGQHNLIYDNHKAARMRRRLPITTETAQVVMAWQHHRALLPAPPVLRDWLFPSPQLRAKQGHGHLTTSSVGRAFKVWVRRIERIDGELLGPDGHPAPFDRSQVTPYALRHSYAQRHADSGVPVDVLKELMDHVAVATTMGYYRISLKRKQQAIRSVGSLATDANGNPAPFTSPTAYQRASVSVPFGNCTEPSNVTAGGGACPIRFQCAGCGFYRPDPSYLPALQEHIASLRADLETARAIGAADYVTANLAAQIDAFTTVSDTMHHRLSELGSDERAEVEQASRLLRRARAGRRLPLTVKPLPVTETG
jgi:integrase